ncbi:hypothetical protein BpHYR1_021744 [Brachionus plicatilis]|uniref:Uncharacterized protein n=1 Tax=Brachionus plicatilis TaxID=10195 RepID=A0A3M7SXE8_BRAPC|nr:hypothetical protein BpHYR1_021744 [Brachionus plicatilis]
MVGVSVARAAFCIDAFAVNAPIEHVAPFGLVVAVGPVRARKVGLGAERIVDRVLWLIVELGRVQCIAGTVYLVVGLAGSERCVKYAAE